ncbi:tyrosine-type recombinase/integrase [Rubinisphaera margarita]|uniref:tyrosine-type recombinase/integrase n=1 Tax=Rubinisphaera margarita TaxID=2909586 RepID=UPI001EE949D7|nr:site-specific integrase [Rubinisphaera margarita]MCG6157115.1 tyrosine-type recombinase/integrase [Rubinisphaera margarita]
MNISVYKPKDRANYMAQWSDPITGRLVRKSTGTPVKRDAERIAGQLLKELESGTYHNDVRITWEAFRERFDDEYLPGVTNSTAARYRTVFNTLERHINPKLLASLNESTLSRFQSLCRKDGNSEATIKANVVHLHAALNWAVEQKLIPRAPKMRAPKNTGKMKGRKITAEEFDRMIESVSKMPVRNPAEWEFLLRGLWWSGLRLGEALNLHWTDPNNICVDLENELLIIQAHAHKKQEYSETPMAPEFVDMLKAVPDDQREGYVFKLSGPRDKSPRPIRETVSATITAIGTKAGIKVSETKRAGKLKVKYASAHDLRRSFGARWSKLVMPTELKELMRHADIKTTMDFYVGQDARETAKRLRAVSAHSSTHTPSETADSGAMDSTQSIAESRVTEKPGRGSNPD